MIQRDQGYADLLSRELAPAKNVAECFIMPLRRFSYITLIFSFQAVRKLLSFIGRSVN